MKSSAKIAFLILLIGTLFLIECVDCAAIKQGKQQPEVLRYEFKQLPYDGYYFLYELSDGQSRSEYGYFDDVNGVLTLNIVGSYSFIGTDDKKHTVKYTANENGYQASEDIKLTLEPPLMP